MTGIKYVVDKRGKKTAVIIDLRKHGRLWEDIYDSYVARARDHEPRETLQSVKKRLERQGKLRA